MEKERRIYDYWAAEDVSKEGKRVREERRKHDDPNDTSKETRTNILIDDGQTAMKYALKKMGISLARFVPIIPAGRGVQKGFIKVRNLFHRSHREAAK